VEEHGKEENKEEEKEENKEEDITKLSECTIRNAPEQLKGSKV